MTRDELFTQVVEEELERDLTNIHSHALWMARIMTEIYKDPGFGRLKPALREEIETICAAVE
jgi:hypothetical protein